THDFPPCSPFKNSVTINLLIRSGSSKRVS
ncbi:MAG: hypothetical protein ACI9EW_004166, partial [Cellvibrionaceae bacterium]